MLITLIFASILNIIVLECYSTEVINPEEDHNEAKNRTVKFTASDNIEL